MSDIYCEYNGLKYKIKKRNNEYILTSTSRDKGFADYIDILGNCHSDLFMKCVTANEVDLIYKEEVFVKYKNMYFQLFANKISKNDVLDNSYMLWTASEQLANEYSFEKKEQFVFAKFITREEIEAVKIVKKPMFDFKDKDLSEEILNGEALDKWLSELI